MKIFNFFIYVQYRPLRILELPVFRRLPFIARLLQGYRNNRVDGSLGIGLNFSRSAAHHDRQDKFMMVLMVLVMVFVMFMMVFVALLVVIPLLVMVLIFHKTIAFVNWGLLAPGFNS